MRIALRVGCGYLRRPPALPPPRLPPVRGALAGLPLCRPLSRELGISISDLNSVTASVPQAERR